MTRVDRIFTAILQLSPKERDELQGRLDDQPKPKSTKATKSVSPPAPPPPAPASPPEPPEEPEEEFEEKVPVTSGLSAAKQALAERQKSDH